MNSLLVTIFQVTDSHNYNNFIIIIIMQIHNPASSKFLEFSFCSFKATAFKFPSLFLQICMYDINCWSLFNCPALTKQRLKLWPAGCQCHLKLSFGDQNFQDSCQLVYWSLSLQPCIKKFSCTVLAQKW